jgi:transposase
LPIGLDCKLSSKTATRLRSTSGAHVLLTVEGVGTSAIMRDTGKSKTCVWRWQERFADEGFEGLLRDKTRPSRIPKLGGPRLAGL